MKLELRKVVALIVIILLLIGLGFYLGRRSVKPCNESITTNYNIDSLTTVLVNIKSDSIEDIYLKRIDSIEQKNKRVVVKLKQYYEGEFIRIKTLPIDDQIILFKEQVFEEDCLPIKVIEKEDTIIKITPNQLIETNIMFSQMNYLFELKDTLEEQLNHSYELLWESKGVLNSKNQEITILKDISTQKDNNILDLNKTLLEQRKTTKKGIIYGSVIGGLVGIIIGGLIIK
jgi:hypothetical protein